jgi:hypothetical protein
MAIMKRIGPSSLSSNWVSNNNNSRRRIDYLETAMFATTARLVCRIGVN